MSENRPADNPQQKPIEREKERNAKRRGRRDDDRRSVDWEPKTRLGRMVKSGKVSTMSQAIASGLPLADASIEGNALAVACRTRLVIPIPMKTKSERWPSLNPVVGSTSQSMIPATRRAG